MAPPKDWSPREDRRQAGGYYAEEVGRGEGMHEREELKVIDPFTQNDVAFVVRRFTEFWVTTIEPWRTKR
jgi:hypothetical protein